MDDEIVVVGRRRRELHDAKAFYATLRQITGKLDTTQVQTIDRLIQSAAHWPLSWVAYALATAWHECRLRPIHEKGGAAYFFRRYDIQGANPSLARSLGNTLPGDGVRFAGRGLVQLTGRTNYKKAGEFLGLDLIAEPDLALDPDIAARILIWGMEKGAFTGKSLAKMLPNERGNAAEFFQARRIINGVDQAALISGYALRFQEALVAGGWGWA